jgi:hydrogenase expression/formation protein HypC
MCLSTLGRILEIEGEALERSASVQMGDAVRTISLALVPDAVVGSWVNVHSGYAIEILSDADAESLLDLTDEIADSL